MSIVIQDVCKSFGNTPVLQHFSWTVDGPAVLMGSSLGGFVAWHAAARLATILPQYPITRLVLLAPAVTSAAAVRSNAGRICNR